MKQNYLNQFKLSKEKIKQRQEAWNEFLERNKQKNADAIALIRKKRLKDAENAFYEYTQPPEPPKQKPKPSFNTEHLSTEQKKEFWIKKLKG